ncbi:acetolactate synthase 2 small subunit [Rheinheimera marina]|uniref:Acetolactate synthase 2 small subunit n=1 Tax=Rheinheimera marina TaxID=1774958 RepID=A0ABV9JJ71_9GAMM
MNHVLTIHTNNEQVALERVLQVTRYRGFELASFEMKPLADLSGLLLTLSINSDKPISLLTNQLAKLYDVQHLECKAAGAAGSMRA